MIKNILFSLIFIITLKTNLFAYDSFLEFSPFPSEFKKALELLEKLPEATAVLTEAQKKGSIKLQALSENDSFDAFWNGSNRTIYINKFKNKEVGVLICSIIFELHNAMTNDHLKQLINLAASRQIDIESYVSGVEKMEHENALKTSRIIEKGIKEGIFPKEAYWPIFQRFEHHYKVQQLQGHSQWLAEQYNGFNPYEKPIKYQGTIKNIDRLTPEDKKDLLAYLKIKDDLEGVVSPKILHAVHLLHVEYSHQNGCRSGTRKDCARAGKKWELLSEALKGNGIFDTLFG